MVTEIALPWRPTINLVQLHVRELIFHFHMIWMHKITVIIQNVVGTITKSCLSGSMVCSFFFSACKVSHQECTKRVIWLVSHKRMQWLHQPLQQNTQEDAVNTSVSVSHTRGCSGYQSLLATQEDAVVTSISVNYMRGCSGYWSQLATQEAAVVTRTLACHTRGCSGYQSWIATQEDTMVTRILACHTRGCSGYQSLDVPHKRMQGWPVLVCHTRGCSGYQSLGVPHKRMQWLPVLVCHTRGCSGYQSLGVPHKRMQWLPESWLATQEDAVATSISVSYMGVCSDYHNLSLN